MDESSHESTPVSTPHDQVQDHQSVPMTEAEWDDRYASEQQIWSGEPNVALVTEVGGLEPGTALDVGCGEGADALWLASQGWQVTALDVSAVALGRAAAEARKRGAEVIWLHAGLLAAPRPLTGFDLVSAQYPSLPSTRERTAERALLDAVALGGHLVVVHHEMALDDAHAHGFDPTGFLGPSTVAELLDEDWSIIVEETRPRHVSTGAGAHHTHDVVLHAQRLA
jgi:SAM-dependent methyltransferase